MPRGPILVLGATGRQGDAVASRLLESGWTVRALVRDPSTLAAQDLAQRGASLVRGDLDDRKSVREALADCYGVFSVQAIDGDDGVAGEERRGKTVVDEAVRAGVRHFVYSSVGAADRATGIPHFESKWRIEQQLRAKALPATILRPTFFMENFSGGLTPRLIDGELVIRIALGPSAPLQMVAVSDIGAIAQVALEHPQEFIGRALELAGDELTGIEIAKAFAAARKLPARYEQQPLAEVRAFSDDAAQMFAWFGREGFKADLDGLRSRFPRLLTLAQWLGSTADGSSAPTSLNVAGRR